MTVAPIAKSLGPDSDANLVSRSRSIRAMALYVSALGVLGAQILPIVLVHLVGS